MSKERQEIENLGIEESAGFKNLVAIRDYAKETRELFRKLEEEVKTYKNITVQQGKEIEGLRTQIQNLQIKLYSKNATT